MVGHIEHMRRGPQRVEVCKTSVTEQKEANQWLDHRKLEPGRDAKEDVRVRCDIKHPSTFMSGSPG